jgi:hypothetical protein
MAVTENFLIHRLYHTVKVKKKAMCAVTPQNKDSNYVSPCGMDNIKIKLCDRKDHKRKTSTFSYVTELIMLVYLLV